MTGVIVSSRAEIVCIRTVDGPHWRLERTTTDDRGTVTRVTVAERDTMRAILSDANAMERQGERVSRVGLTREVGEA